MVGMRMRLMWLGSTGGIPEPLLFLSIINDSSEKLKSRISIPVRGNIHFVVKVDVLGENRENREITFSNH